MLPITRPRPSARPPFLWIRCMESNPNGYRSTPLLTHPLFRHSQFDEFFQNASHFDFLRVISWVPAESWVKQTKYGFFVLKLRDTIHRLFLNPSIVTVMLLCQVKHKICKIMNSNISPATRKRQCTFSFDEYVEVSYCYYHITSGNQRYILILLDWAHRQLSPLRCALQV